MCPTACLGCETNLSSICSQKCLTGRELKANSLNSSSSCSDCYCRPQAMHAARWKPPALLTSYTKTYIPQHMTVLQYCNFLHLQHVSVALTETVDAPQPQKGSCGWSQWLSVEPAIVSASHPVFSNKFHSSRVLFSLRILHNLYLFAQCQLDVCLSA